MVFFKKNITIFIILLLVFFDQWLKVYVKLNLKLYEQLDIFSWFKINFIENNGMAFGYELGGYTGKLFLTLFRILAVIFISIWLKKLIKKKENILIIISIVLILSGAIGNILDSIYYGLIFNESTPHLLASFMPKMNGYAPLFHGKVVDMLYFPLWEGFELEYIEIVDKNTLESISEKSDKDVMAFIAVFVDGVRLIDNIKIN